MEISSKQILKVLYVLSWIIFIGLCVEAGGFIFNTFFTIFINPIDAGNFWNRMDLSSLYKYNSGYFLVVISFMIIIALLKAIMFYLILKILHNKKLNLLQPFNNEVRRFIFNISYLALGIGLFSNWGSNYSKWLVKQAIEMPSMESLHLDGADVWLFMAVMLYIIAYIFKRGIEIQTENELTI